MSKNRKPRKSHEHKWIVASLSDADTRLHFPKDFGLTQAQVARFLKVSREAVSKRVRRKRMPSVMVFGTEMLLWRDVREWLSEFYHRGKRR